MTNPYAYDKALLDDLNTMLDELRSGTSADRKKIIETSLPKLSARVKVALNHLISPKLGRPQKHVKFIVSFAPYRQEEGAFIGRFGDDDKMPEDRELGTYEEVAKLLRLAPSTTRQQMATGRGVVTRKVKNQIITVKRIEFNPESK